MIQLQCKSCKKFWYTACENTELTCDDCGGELVKVDFDLVERKKEKEISTE